MTTRRRSPRFNRGRIPSGAAMPSPPGPPTDIDGVLAATAQSSTTSLEGTVISNVAGVLASTAQSSTSGFTGTVQANPQTIFGSNCKERWKSTNGVTIGTGVSSWLGMVAGTDAANATGANQPTYNATGGPNGKPSLLFDGSNDSLAATFARAAPGTTPSVIILVARQITWTANDPLTNDVAAHGVIRQVGVSPALVIFCGGAANQSSNTAATLNTYVRIQAKFFNSTSDVLRVVATDGAVTLATTGNAAGTGPLFGRNNAATLFGNFELCEVVFLDVNPSAGQQTDVDAYITDEYGSGLV